MSEKNQLEVTLSITASGDVGSGKSRALEIVKAALQHSRLVKVLEVHHCDVGRAENSIIRLTVKEPWKSER